MDKTPPQLARAPFPVSGSTQLRSTGPDGSLLNIHTSDTFVSGTLVQECQCDNKADISPGYSTRLTDNEIEIDSETELLQ